MRPFDDPAQDRDVGERHATRDPTRDTTRIDAVRPLITPALLMESLPVSEATLALVESSREAIARALHGEDAIAAACALLCAAGQREQVMVDVSHANSEKQHQRQVDIGVDIAARIAAGERRIAGAMIESHLEEGRQDPVAGQPLRPGVSITDACIGWQQTAPLLQGLAQAVRARG